MPHPSDSSASARRPIFIVGAGSIVRDAHIPAYRLAGFEIGGIFDRDQARSQAIGREFGVRALATEAEIVDACARAGGVYDLALPPAAVAGVLEALPAGSFVLTQKPFGGDLAQATELRAVAARKRIRGVVNFQLRHAPAVAMARSLVADGAIGDAVDLELRVVCRMPWETWPFLRGMPRMEILMHAIHYLDLARALMGEPARVWSATAGHPGAREFADTRSTTTMTFGAERRAVVTTFHHHAAPEGHDASHLRIEGTRGTVVARLGVNLDYPRGRPDTLEISRGGGAWERIAVEGNWFPHAFIGPMRSLQRLAAGGAGPVESDFDDAWRTMALVETCYKSAAAGEVVPELPR